MCTGIEPLLIGSAVAGGTKIGTDLVSSKLNKQKPGIPSDNDPIRQLLFDPSLEQLQLGGLDKVRPTPPFLGGGGLNLIDLIR